MKLNHIDLITEYYSSIQKEYPDLSLEHCNEICSTPFLHTRKAIELGELPTIRLKFFGTFIAYPKRVKGILKQYEKMFKEHRITPQIYFKKKEQLEKFLSKHESKDKLG